MVIVKKEILEEKDNVISNTQDIYAFEILDGYPISNKQIPLRLFLAGVPNLTPTYEKINNKISVWYFLELKIIDEIGWKYFKQNEIFLSRKQI